MNKTFKTVLSGVLFLVLIISPFVESATRDLIVEQQIKDQIQIYNQNKTKYDNDVAAWLVKIADPMIIRGSELFDQAQSIHDATEAYLKAADISDDKAALYVELVDSHIDIESLRQKQEFMKLFVSLCNLLSEILTDEVYNIPDPNSV